VKLLSPCIDKCENKNGYCTGCFRSISEISEWKTLCFIEKLEIYKKIEKRKRLQLK